MDADDLVITLKKSLAKLSRTERRKAVELVGDVVRAAMFDDAAGDGYEVERCPRCGSVAIVKKGKSRNGEQRYLCRDCGRTFSGSTGRVLGTSKLPRETWMAYAECFVLMLPLRECAGRCGVCLKTAWTMRHRLIECLKEYPPEFHVGQGQACELENRVSTPERFGFMWECPSYIELDAKGGAPAKWLSFSPQGLESGRWDRGNVYAAGYMPVTGDITAGKDAYDLGEFRLWDAGFDFYAPQEFTAEDGRHILIGWMGMPDEPTYGNDPTVACGWQHCMTVPRELTVGAGGVVLQQPAREIEHHYASVRVGEGSLEVAGDTCFDVIVAGVDGAFSATVDGELKLAFVPAEGELPARFEMRFTDEARTAAGCGRAVRWEPVDEVRNVRIVGDASSVEVFVNDGALVFSTRIFPEAYGVTVDAVGASVTYHALNI